MSRDRSSFRRSSSLFTKSSFKHRLLRKIILSGLVIGIPVLTYILSSSYAASQSTANVPTTYYDPALNNTAATTTSTTKATAPLKPNTSSSSASTQIGVVGSQNTPNTSSNISLQTSQSSSTPGSTLSSTNLSVNGQNVPIPANGTVTKDVGQTHVTVSRNSYSYVSHGQTTTDISTTLNSGG